MKFSFMQPASSEPQATTELVPLKVIRVETALTRYPVHRLAKQGTVSIEIHEKSPNGEVLIQWEVSHNSRYGQPGPLAYKIDTLIVNRRIEGASRPIPRIIKLGSLHDICRELGLRGGKPRDNVKKALYQNAFAAITAKLRYKLSEGKGQKELEAGFTRYSVVFTGEELPDGRKADAVYLVLNEVFMQVINGAKTRPLDYDYLKDLPPASQRLYELLSFEMFAALNNGRREAKLSYSEFCTYAPLTRFLKWDQVRPQMARIHRPHLKSGYIESVEFEQSADRDGKPDWLMVYVPGSRAKAEYRAFNKRGGSRVLVVETPEASLEPVKVQEEPSPLELELFSRGVTRSTASELVAGYPEEDIRRQIEHFDWLKQHHPKKVSDSPGGFLAQSVRGEFDPPPKFVSKADKERKVAEQKEKLRQEAAATEQKFAAQAREAEIHKRVLAYWNAMTPEEQRKLDAEAEAKADPSVLAGHREMVAQRNSMKDTNFRVNIRFPHIRRVLGFSPAATQEPR